MTIEYHNNTACIESETSNMGNWIMLCYNNVTKAVLNYTIGFRAPPGEQDWTVVQN